MKPKLKSYLGKLVCVKWYDSYYDKGWNYDADTKPTLNDIFTYGIVTFVDDRLIEIVSTHGGRNGMLNPLIIPIGCVIDVKELR